MTNVTITYICHQGANLTAYFVEDLEFVVEAVMVPIFRIPAIVVAVGDIATCTE